MSIEIIMYRGYHSTSDYVLGGTSICTVLTLLIQTFENTYS